MKSLRHRCDYYVEPFNRLIVAYINLPDICFFVLGWTCACGCFAISDVLSRDAENQGKQGRNFFPRKFETTLFDFVLKICQIKVYLVETHRVIRKATNARSSSFGFRSRHFLVSPGPSSLIHESHLDTPTEMLARWIHGRREKLRVRTRTHRRKERPKHDLPRAACENVGKDGGNYEIPAILRPTIGRTGIYISEIPNGTRARSHTPHLTAPSSLSA